MLLGVEQLEPRFLLSADVNADGILSPADALTVINAINGDVPAEVSHDVNRDSLVTPIDALIVINCLPEPEPPPVAPEPAATIFRVRIDAQQLGHSISPQDMVEGVRLGLQPYTEVADVDFQLSHGGGGWDVRVVGTVVQFGGQHFRGNYAGGGLIQLHNGLINGRINENVWTGGPVQVGKIVAHEFGHHLGWGHTSDRNCLMHSNASAPFCQVEINRLISRFGASTVPEGRL